MVFISLINLNGNNYMDNNSLASKEHWETTYENIKYAEVSDNSEISVWLKEQIKDNFNNHKTCFEIGIFPSSYSTIFGKMGYQINGIDRVSEVNKSMKEWLLHKGYNVGDLFCEDFFKFNTKNKYDIVCSFGFIEHFKNFEEVIKRHTLLVKDNGFIILENPNFRGLVQNFLKYFLDKKNLDIHYLPSMNFYRWEKVLTDAGFEIIAKDYLGKFSFQTYPQKRNFIQKKLIKFINDNRYFIKKQLFKKSSKHYSPNMILLAKKIK